MQFGEFAVRQADLEKTITAAKGYPADLVDARGSSDAERWKYAYLQALKRLEELKEVFEETARDKKGQLLDTQSRLSQKVGIYPPDALSRTGRFLTELARKPPSDDFGQEQKINRSRMP